MSLEQCSDLLLRDIAREAVERIEQEFHQITAALVMDSTHQTANHIQTLAPHNDVPDVQMFQQTLTDKARLDVTLGNQGTQRLQEHRDVLVVALGSYKADILIQIERTTTLVVGRGREITMTTSRERIRTLT